MSDAPNTTTGVYPGDLERLRRLKDRDGRSHKEIVRRALDLYEQSQGTGGGVAGKPAAVGIVNDPASAG